MKIQVPDLKKLAVLQEELDKHILEKQKIDYDVTDELIVAFKVEFGEFLNEQKFFKFWKVDRTPRTQEILYKSESGSMVVYSDKNPLLEEFVDGIHCLLSVGNRRNYVRFAPALEVADLTGRLTFSNLALDIFENPISSAGQWLDCMLKYLCFAHLTGINAEEIEAAYLKKNAINHERQESGY